MKQRTAEIAASIIRRRRLIIGVSDIAAFALQCAKAWERESFRVNGLEAESWIESGQYHPDTARAIREVVH